MTARAPDERPLLPGKAAPPEHLLPHHAKMIADSAISPEVAKARGYRTATKKVELEALGFSPRQRLVPSLIIPIIGPHGDVELYQSRPDVPRIEKGKPVKYETPKGAHMALDVPPGCSGALGNPAVDLIITEGVRKADAAASQGLCCIALLGVWNFRGTNEHGGKAILGAWESIALNGRNVYIAFDSDVMKNEAVAKALERLAAFLVSRKANVHFVYFAPTATGAKVGLDDYFAAGNTVADLMLLAESEMRRSPIGNLAPRPIPYTATSHGIIYEKDTREGPVDVLLSNFTAEIVADVCRDNGVEESRSFDIAIKLNSVERTVSVSHDEFFSMSWPTKHLGCHAIIEPGAGIRDHFRAAVQYLSPNAENRTVFTHTGWRSIGDSSVFLSGGQAIGTVGTVGTVATEYEGALAKFSLPDPPDREQAAKALRESLKSIVNLAPDHVTLPLLAAVFRAPLGDTDFVLHFFGGTGTMKTEAAALAQQFYGAGMNSRNLPGNWASTPNALCELAFLAKDCVAVIDDFAPNGGAQDVSQLHQKAERVIRGVGNRSGRGRLNAQLTLRAERPPRALIISTGEEIPRGHSIRGRIVAIEITKGDVKADILTDCQRLAAEGVFALVMSGYVRWLAGPIEEERKDLRPRARAYGEETSAARPHARFPENMGQLRIGFECFLKWGVEIGAISASEADGLRSRLRGAFVTLADIQSGVLASSDLGRQFMTATAAMLTAKRARLEPIDNCTLRREVLVAIGSSNDEGSSAGSRIIGWADGESAYLDPEVTLSEVQRFVHDQGGHIGFEIRAIERALRDGGFIVSFEKSRGRLTTRKTIGGVRRAVLHLKLCDLVPLVSIAVPTVPTVPGDQKDEADQELTTADLGTVDRDGPRTMTVPASDGPGPWDSGTVAEGEPSQPQPSATQDLPDSQGRLGRSTQTQRGVQSEDDASAADRRIVEGDA